jgi:putative glutamine amidotransferase
MTKPLIGITPDVRAMGARGDAHVLLSTYVAMIADAGGIPVIVPVVRSREEAREVIRRLDGLLLTGGKDLDASLYGQTTRRPDRLASSDRAASDLAYARAAFEVELPTLGVCLGVQVMNVGDGGSLFQHVPEDLPGGLAHEDEDPDRDAPRHEAAIEPGTILARILGTDRAVVNSYHHQSIAQIAPGWRLAARAPDGVVEAIERPDRAFYLGVQWHPERMPDSEITRRLAGALVDAARGVSAPSPSTHPPSSRTPSGSR